MLYYGGDAPSAWNTPLHVDKDGKSPVNEKRKKNTETTSATVDLPQGLIRFGVSTLGVSLNKEIKCVNERHKADAATTKAAIRAMESRLTKRMDDQSLVFKLLYKGQVHMEENLRMIMQQVGL